MVFVVYVNDLYKGSHRLTHGMLANDTNLAANKNVLRELLFLAKANKFPLNEKKQNILLFTRNVKQIT